VPLPVSMPVPNVHVLILCSFSFICSKDAHDYMGVKGRIEVSVTIVKGVIPVCLGCSGLFRTRVQNTEIHFFAPKKDRNRSAFRKIIVCFEDTYSTLAIDLCERNYYRFL
jgi:hypothetical protein